MYKAIKKLFTHIYFGKKHVDNTVEEHLVLFFTAVSLSAVKKLNE